MKRVKEPVSVGIQMDRDKTVKKTGSTAPLYKAIYWPSGEIYMEVTWPVSKHQTPEHLIA